MATKNLTADETRALLEKMTAQAFHLVREIQKRDGEGNTIPDYLYSGLLLSLGRAVDAGINPNGPR